MVTESVSPVQYRTYHIWVGFTRTRGFRTAPMYPTGFMGYLRTLLFPVQGLDQIVRVVLGDALGDHVGVLPEPGGAGPRPLLPRASGDPAAERGALAGLQGLRVVTG